MQQNLNERRKSYVRISEILNRLQNYDFVKPEILLAKQELGTHVHEAINDLIKGQFPIVNSKEFSYLKSFQLWHEEYKPLFSLTEERLYDDDLKITGQIDGLGRFQNQNTDILIDFKTSIKESPTWIMQGHLYHHLLKKNNIPVQDRFLFIKLHKEGKKPKVYEYQYSEAIWENCLNAVSEFFNSLF